MAQHTPLRQYFVAQHTPLCHKRNFVAQHTPRRHKRNFVHGSIHTPLNTLRSFTNAINFVAQQTPLRHKRNFVPASVPPQTQLGGRGRMTTLLHRHPEQYLHTSRFTRYLQCFHDVGPSYMAWLNTLRSATNATCASNTNILFQKMCLNVWEKSNIVPR